MVFVSVIRIVTVWFLVRQAPMVTQLTGLTGQLGAIAAAGPLAYLLHALGWTRAFALTSSVGVVLLVAVLALVKDSPYRGGDVVAIKLRALAQSVRTVWGNPGTRLGMWSHFTSQFSATVFALLWGYPFLVQGLGWTPGGASTLLMAMTAWAVVSGLVLARLVARLPYYRSFIVLGVVAAMVVPWTAVLLWPGVAPDVGGRRDGVRHGQRRAGLDGRLRPGPLLHAGAGDRPRQRPGQRRRLHRLAAHDGADRGGARPVVAPAGWAPTRSATSSSRMAVQYAFWALGVVQVLRYRRRGLAHLARVHPGSVEQMRAGPAVRPPGDRHRGRADAVFGESPGNLAWRLALNFDSHEWKFRAVCGIATLARGWTPHSSEWKSHRTAAARGCAQPISPSPSASRSPVGSSAVGSSK